MSSSYIKINIHFYTRYAFLIEFSKVQIRITNARGTFYTVTIIYYKYIWLKVYKITKSNSTNNLNKSPPHYTYNTPRTPDLKPSDWPQASNTMKEIIIHNDITKNIATRMRRAVILNITAGQRHMCPIRIICGSGLYICNLGMQNVRITHCFRRLFFSGWMLA